MIHDQLKFKKYIDDVRIRQFLRFGVVGVLSSALHYGIYYLLLFITAAAIAYAAGYVISFICNYCLTNYYTFQTQPSWKHFLGFAGSHAVNFGLHMVLFSLFLWIGMHKLLIPIVVMGIAMLVQFTILRWVFVKRDSRSQN
jgi:putative flippase GtrA